MIQEYRHSEQSPYHISAGGIVYEYSNDSITVLLLGRNEEDGVHYHLPKGTLHYNETLEDCAQREVKEESGYDGEVEAFLGGFTQDYIARDGLPVSKTVLYFAMKKVGDEAYAHDDEHDFVEWLEIDKAIDELRRTEPKKEEYTIVERLKEYLENRT